MPNVVSWGLLDGNPLARTVGRELSNPSSYTNAEFIQAAERAAQKNPDEWVIYYSLADKYQAEGYYSLALEAAQKCNDIKPNDLRSAYALASCYYILTRANWSANENELADLFKMVVGDVDKLDKKYSQAGLDHTGITIELAAVQAIRWFERCLTLKPDRQSKEMINASLQALYSRFPHLKQ